MTPKDFLKAVWPRAGIYCLATPYKIPNTDRVTFTHKTFTDLDAAAQYAEQNKSRYNIFFAVHTLKEPKVWNPEKPNYKTGELGAYEVRKQTNMLGSRCFFFDLDVDPDNHRKYATQGEAAAGLKQFCKDAGLPKPLVTSSGGGLHVYWIVEDLIEAQEWKNHAIKLRQVARHYGLKFDPMRTTDVSSVLRVAGTFNLKKDNPRPVRALTPVQVLSNKQFIKLLDDATTRAGVTVSTAPNFFDDVDGNLSEEYSGPPTTLRAMATACAQVRYLVKQQGNVSEPEWYHSINLVRFVENGDKLVHRISQGHPEYDPAATDAKVAQLRAKGIKPTSCLKLAEVCGEERCEGCIFAGKVKSPIVAARWKDPAPTPVVETQVGLNTITVTIPPPPKPYTRMKDGKIAMIAKNKDGDEMPTIIYEHDLYPLRRLVNDVSQSEQHVWCVVHSRGGKREFILDADALYDRRKFVLAIANHGLYPKHANLQHMQDYMIAYISELQRLADADAQCNHLGWIDDMTKFVLPDKILLADGTAKPASLSLGAQRSSAQVMKKGTLQRQVELMQFYNHPSYIPNQFFILASLGAAIFEATGHHGVVVNATGDPGASKSTSLYTAASFWGQPELYPLNGTNNGATLKARNERITTLANLPVCVDEITHMPAKDAVDLAMSVTQPGHRVRLEHNGVERSANGGYKATIMLTTANASLHTLLSTDNAAGTAGSMRVVEIQFKRQHVHSKAQADDFLHDLKQNFGHIGEQFMVYVVPNLPAVRRMVRDEMRSIDEECNIQPSERYWSGYAAAVLAAARIANARGLLPFSPEEIRRWVVTQLIPEMRGVVIDEYTTPSAALADYLEHINGNILFMANSRGFGGTTMIPAKMPHGELLARYEIDERRMWVSVKGFKDWCIRQGLNYRRVLDDLNKLKPGEAVSQRMIPNTNTRRVLGSGTELAKAQSRTFVINMDHPDIRDAVDIDEVTAKAVPKKPHLRVV